MEKVDIQQVFAVIAGKNSVLGDPQGEKAYGYTRVSSAGQAEEGSSGIPRQIEHIHKAAIRDNLYIPFEFLYVDDGYSGFEFAGRPALTRLIYDVRTNKQVFHLVVEEIDRLSRNADWHQGFLLNEFTRRKVKVHFYNEPGSELERYVRGYIAQESMRKELERMQLGRVYKAMDGRVTAVRSAYGYDISDPKDSHYVINDEEAGIVTSIYNWLTEDRATLYTIATRLNEMGVPGRRGGTWSPGTLLNLVRNEVYKGWFITNRKTYEVAGYDEDGKPKRKWRTRPESEWIWVPVPPIVTEEQWDEAHKVLESNRKYSKRRMGTHTGWLLSSLIECDICHYTFGAARGGSHKKGQVDPIRYYYCRGRASHKAKAHGITCRSPYVHADALEEQVWNQIQEVILHPERVFSFIDNEYTKGKVTEYTRQFEYLSSQIANLQREISRWDAAYAREIIDLDEYQEKVEGSRSRIKRHQEDLDKVKKESEAFKKQEDVEKEVRRRLDGLRNGNILDLPFETRRKILTLIVDKIVVNSEAGKATIFGAIPPIHFEISSAR